MRENLRNVAIALALLVSVVASAQERLVSGKVTGEDGSGLPGVNVLVKGTTNGTVTDSEGQFRVEAGSNSILVFSFVGYASQEVPVGDRTSFSITLQPDAKQLSEVIVTAYGTEDKKSFAGSAVAVNSEAISMQPIRGLEQALQGNAAGVQVTQNSGTPGGGIAVRVRGSSSILAGNEPLYVVDGIPINTGSYSQIGVGNQQANSLADINPNDIASLEVLKDAAAAALYGSRASNGVVLITTKRGKSGNAKIALNYYGGYQEVWKQMTPLTGAQFIDALGDALVGRFGIGAGTTANPQGVSNADGTVSTGSLFGSGAQTWLNKNHLASWYWAGNSTFTIDGSGRAVVSRSGAATELNDAGFYLDPTTAPSTNWQNQVFQSAPIHNADLNLSGGNEKMKYFSSFGYFKQDGIIKGSGFERYSGRLNLDFAASSKLNFNLSNLFSRSVSNRINNDNNIFGVLSTAILNAPDFPVRLSNGTYARDPRNSIDNPLAQALDPTNLTASTRLNSNFKGTYEIIPNLNFSSNIGVDFLYFKEDRFIPTTTAQGLSTNGRGDANIAQEINWLNENILTYNKSFGGEHNLSLLAGATYQESRQSTITAQATGFPGNNIRVLGAGSVKVDASSGATSWALTSYLARASYDFKGKYFFNASFRADESSRFSKDNRVGLFPAVSGAWRVIEENFMKNVPVLSDLKVRASFGSTGNQNFGNFNQNFVNFNYLSLFAPGTNYLQTPGFAPTQLANDNLKWETTDQFNAGIDFGLFSKVTLSVDYYVKSTRDLLLNRPIPSTSGFTVYTQNIGSMENRGIEVVISATPLNSKQLVWKSDFNIAFNQNKITKLAADVLPFGAGFASWIQEGQPIGSFRGFKVDRIFQAQDEINTLNAASPTGVYQSSLTRPGDIKFQDLNGDGVINSLDQDILGSAQPTFIGGFTNTINYKGFDLSIFAQFVSGNKIYNNTRSFTEGMNGIFGQAATVLNRWTPTNTNTTMPRAALGDPNNNRRTSDRWLEDGSFLRIKSVVLGYTLPNSILKRLKIERMRVYASAQNLLTFTNYSGLDPEVNTFSGSNTALGTDFLTFPQPRTITFGVNLNF